MTVGAAGIQEALHLADKTPAWLARRANMPLRRILRLIRRTVPEPTRGSDVRTVGRVLARVGVRLTIENDPVEIPDVFTG